MNRTSENRCTQTKTVLELVSGKRIEAILFGAICPRDAFCGQISGQGKVRCGDAHALIGDKAFRASSGYEKLAACHAELLKAIESGHGSQINSSLKDCLRLAEPHLSPSIKRIGVSDPIREKLAENLQLSKGLERPRRIGFKSEMNPVES